MKIKAFLYNQPEDLPLTLSIDVSNEFAPDDPTIRSAVLALASEFPGDWNVSAIRKEVDLEVSLSA